MCVTLWWVCGCGCGSACALTLSLDHGSRTTRDGTGTGTGTGTGVFVGFGGFDVYVRVGILLFPKFVSPCPSLVVPPLGFRKPIFFPLDSRIPPPICKEGLFIFARETRVRYIYIYIRYIDNQKEKRFRGDRDSFRFQSSRCDIRVRLYRLQLI